ncbi:hypothetical protein ASE25_11300 [Terrabacter sp. Root85]|uniref:DUF7674 family protein n=1 Tax=Terrabacter sp. Root85 TaxID=1736603 RepID=UPI0006FFED00|nr:hypothetical protein [Terrabacter sp. Root85]KRC90069.1 hypothetical protein ASE25_11300 [Terrabacter sp. Root85]
MITRDSFADQLRAAVPEAKPVVAEHLADNDEELLLHLLMGDLQRMAVSAFDDGDLELTRRLLDFVDQSFRDGDADVNNAVAVSFVEHFGALPLESDALLDLWPSALRRELGR